jgi:outer membrane lipoprotein-sorting protein
MTNIDEQHNHDRLDDNLDRLLKLSEPAPRMPENLKARIRTRLAEVGQVSEKKKFLLRRWAIVSPLAAAAVLALFLIFFWPGGKQSAISWADVQKQIEQVHTMTARVYGEYTTPDQKLIWGWLCMKVYIKDPGLFRCEIYDTEGDLNALSEPQWITILKREPNLNKGLTLHPDSHWAEMWTGAFHRYGQEPSTLYFKKVLQGPNLNYGLEQWNKMKKVAAGETKRIGDREINGRPAEGFSFEIPAKDLGLGDDYEPAKIPGKIWVNKDNGEPLLTELEFPGQGHNVFRYVTSDIQWNVPIDEKLFDLTAPVGWRVSKHLDNSIEYTGIGLSPGVTLEIGPDGQKSLAAAGDVAGLVKTERTTNPDVDPGCTGLITIELTPAAAKRLRDYTEAHPDKRIVVNFNGEIKSAAKLDAAHPTQVSFDITQLRLSMFKVEEKYATTIAAID